MSLEALTLNVTAQFSWVVGTGLGLIASKLIGDIKPLGLDYALAAMFIGFLVSQCQSPVRVITAIFSGGYRHIFVSCRLASVSYHRRNGDWG